MMKCMVFFSCLLTAIPTLAFLVMIDPGHGGIDTGAVRGSLKESQLVLNVALKLKTRLEAVSGVQVQMTRLTDNAVSLPDRVKKAAHAGSDLFVSLHANSSPDARARGMELFFQNSLPPDEDALFLANLENQAQLSDEDIATDISRKGDVAAILEDLHRQSRILASLKFTQVIADVWKDHPGRGPAIKQAPLYVVSKSSMPSVLVEIGFLTHTTESKQLATSDYQDLIASRLNEAILRYKARVAPDSSISNSVE